jgi:glycosyltransferase involved in cell wall biosynthesis
MNENDNTLHGKKVAIVHYWLIGMRGGEKVLEDMLEIFPGADIYTHVYNPSAVSAAINAHKIITSPVNKLPFAKKLYKLYMPLMPNALLKFNLQQYDLVISSEAGPAKGIVPAPDAYHICFCHSPMRYLWDMYHEYFKGTNFFVRFFMKRLVPRLRLWDITSANMVDRFITNSNFVAKRIRRYYRREAKVVFVPVDIQKYSAAAREQKDFYLFFGQVAENKGIAIALEAFASNGKNLYIAGGGAKKKLIARYKKYKNIKFLGRVSDVEAQRLFSGAQALIFPGIEDMGIIPIEANAAGCPVIAFRKGGATETVKENVTGIFFDEQNPACLANAVEQFERMKNSFDNRNAFSDHVAQFSREAFKARIIDVVNERLYI